MKKPTLTLLALLALTLTGCEEDQRGQISTAQQPKDDVDYQVTFLFEVDSVKVYRFYDHGREVYFTNVTGNIEYTYTSGNVKARTTHNVQCVKKQKQILPVPREMRRK